MRVNSFCTVDPLKALKSCDKVIYCGSEEVNNDNIIRVLPFGESHGGEVYLPSMCDETVLEEFCDRIITTGSKAIVRAAYDIEESGIIEARYKLSPIMLLHKLGVLSNCTVVGGVCLDNDDLDLMAQENVPLVLTPTASAGYGYGFAPICAAVRRGMRVGVGTFDGKYNSAVDLAYELEFLRLVTNADMSVENALSRSALDKIAAFDHVAD